MPDSTMNTATVDDDISPPPTKRRKLSVGSSVASPVTETAALSPPNPSHLRVYSWNINGIQPFLQPSITSFMRKSTSIASQPDDPFTTSLRDFLRRHHWPQVLHLQEIKVKPSDTATKAAIERAVNICRSGTDNGPQYNVRFCLPRDPYNAIGFGRKIYGVASVIRQDYWDKEVTRCREVDWDLEGRILVIETQSRLALWNIYAVNGTVNPYKSPATGQVQGTRHDRKLAFHAALLHECKTMEGQGWHHVLAGDMNVARAEIDGYPRLRTKPDQHCRNREDFNAKFFDGVDGLKAIDSFRWLHPTKKKYTWLSRNAEWKSSCDRVDYILLSRGLVEGPDRLSRLVEADMLMTQVDRGPSDHVPLWVELDVAPR